MKLWCVFDLASKKHEEHCKHWRQQHQHFSVRSAMTTENWFLLMADSGGPLPQTEAAVLYELRMILASAKDL